jgi:hypothetical protein
VTPAELSPRSQRDDFGISQIFSGMIQTECNDPWFAPFEGVAAEIQSLGN